MIYKGIYAITNILTDTVYYGQAVDLGTRISRHKTDLKLNRHPNQYLQRSYNKYGLGAFVFNPVEIVDNVETLTQKEQSYIDGNYFLGLKSFNFNDAEGTRRGIPHTEETKAKMRTSNPHYWLGRIVPRDIVAKRTAHSKGNTYGTALKGVPKTEEWKAKMSKIKTGRKRAPFSEEWKNNMSKALMGNTHRRGKKFPRKVKSNDNSGNSDRYI